MTTEYKTLHAGTMTFDNVEPARLVEFKCDTDAVSFSAVDDTGTIEKIEKEIRLMVSSALCGAKDSGAFDMAFQRGFWGTVEVFVTWRVMPSTDEATPAPEEDHQLQQQVCEDLEKVLEVLEFFIQHDMTLRLVPAQAIVWKNAIETAHDVLFS